MVQTTRVERRETNSKIVAVRLKEDDLAALNQRFRIDGFETLSDLVRGYLNGEISRAGRTDKVERLLMRLKEINITDTITGEITPIFYKNIDVEDFRRYLRTKYKTCYRPPYQTSKQSYYYCRGNYFISVDHCLSFQMGYRYFLCLVLFNQGRLKGAKGQHSSRRNILSQSLAEVQQIIWLA